MLLLIKLTIEAVHLPNNMLLFEPKSSFLASLLQKILSKHIDKPKNLRFLNGVCEKFCTFANNTCVRMRKPACICSKIDLNSQKAKQHKRLLRSVIKGLVARRDTVGGVAF